MGVRMVECYMVAVLCGALGGLLHAQVPESSVRVETGDGAPEVAGVETVASSDGALGGCDAGCWPAWELRDSTCPCCCPGALSSITSSSTSSSMLFEDILWNYLGRPVVVFVRAVHAWDSWALGCLMWVWAWMWSLL